MLHAMMPPSSIAHKRIVATLGGGVRGAVWRVDNGALRLSGGTQHGI
jgi:hypothetical protein